MSEQYFEALSDAIEALAKLAEHHLQETTSATLFFEIAVLQHKLEKQLDAEADRIARKR